MNYLPSYSESLGGSDDRPKELCWDGLPAGEVHFPLSTPTSSSPFGVKTQRWQFPLLILQARVSFGVGGVGQNVEVEQLSLAGSILSLILFRIVTTFSIG